MFGINGKIERLNEYRDMFFDEIRSLKKQASNIRSEQDTIKNKLKPLEDIHKYVGQCIEDALSSPPKFKKHDKVEYEYYDSTRLVVRDVTRSGTVRGFLLSFNPYVVTYDVLDDETLESVTVREDDLTLKNK